MAAYIVRRLLQSIIVVVGVTVLVYFILFQTGDPTFLSVSENASAEDIAHTRHLLGYDRPWYVQYADYMSGLMRGDQLSPADPDNQEQERP